jgi:hypothetical protein
MNVLVCVVSGSFGTVVGTRSLRPLMYPVFQCLSVAAVVYAVWWSSYSQGSVEELNVAKAVFVMWMILVPRSIMTYRARQVFTAKRKKRVV